MDHTEVIVTVGSLPSGCHDFTKNHVFLSGEKSNPMPSFSQARNDLPYLTNL